MASEHGQCAKVHECSFDNAVDMIKASSNIIVLTGAGISTSLGIPDFRSAGGLYAQLQTEDSGVDEPEDLFRLETFRENPSRFYTLVAQKLLTPLSEDGTPRFTPTHAFIKLLQDKGKLLTNYTQNIDGLEIVAGITQLVQTHGSIAAGRCMRCGKEHKKNFRSLWDQGALPACRKCDEQQQKSLARRREKRGVRGALHEVAKRPERRLAKRIKYNEREIQVEHVLRPNIVFFDESLPAKYGGRLKADKGKVDLLIIIGTSLEIKPLSKLPLEDPIKEKPMIWINQTASTDKFQPAIQLLGKCDIVVEELARRLGWDFDHKMLQRKNAQVELVEDSESCLRVSEQPKEQMKEEFQYRAP
jgi:NAD+-dependent protein deacetylase SIR2